MPTYSVVGQGGEMYGPVDAAALLQWAQEGRVLADTVVYCHESKLSVPAIRLPALSPAFMAARPQQPAATPVDPRRAVVRQPEPSPEPEPQPQPEAEPEPQQPQPAAAIEYHSQPTVANQPSHRLSEFSVPVAVILHYVTFMQFTVINFNLMHGQLPNIRKDDPSGAKGVGFMFIPLFNLYWMFFTFLRLCHRIDEQREVYGLRPSKLNGMAIAALVMLLIPVVNLIAFLIVIPIFVSKLQTSVNELVIATRRAQGG